MSSKLKNFISFLISFKVGATNLYTSTVPKKGKGPYTKETTLGNIAGDGAIDGKGAFFDVFTDDKKLVTSIVISGAGGGYQKGEIVTLSGKDLGGSSPKII